MIIDFQVIKDFYASKKGKSFSQIISSNLAKITNVRNKSILKLGYLEPFLTDKVLMNNITTGILPNNYVFHNGDVPYSYKINQDLCSIQLKTASQNMVVTVNVIEYSENLEKTIREIWRILKDGGKLIIITPLVYNIYNVFHNTPFKLAQKFTENNLARILEKNDFSITYSKIIQFPPQPKEGPISRYMYSCFSMFSSVLIIEASKGTFLRIIASKVEYGTNFIPQGN